MACITHVCSTPKCYYAEFSNDLKPRECPKCREPLLKQFDEAFDYAPLDDLDDEVSDKGFAEDLDN